MTTNKKFCSENKFTYQERYQTSTFPRTKKAPLIPCKAQQQTSGKSIGQTLSLISFVKKYSSSLPIRVSVVEGYSGRDDRSEISSGDMFDFHFLKSETVMSIKDNFGKTYYIPFSSPAKFGIFYNPCNNLQRAKMGYAFTTVSDIVDYDKPPYIIRATTKFVGGGPQNSVYANEVLIIKTVGFGATRNDHYIKVYSLLLNKEKMLYGDCSGNFVTGPTGVALHPTDILQFFGHILPLRAVVVVNADVTDESMLHLESQIVTLYGTSTEYSVIATPLTPNSDSSRLSINTEEYMAISMPNDLKIKVAAVENQPDDEELFRKTRDLFESLDLTKVKDLRRPGCSSTHSAQLHFYEEIGREGRHPSIVFKKPERVYAKLTTSSKIPPRSSAYTLPTPLKTRHMLSILELRQLPPRQQLMGNSPVSKSLSTSSLPSTLRPAEPRRNKPLKALPIPALRKVTEQGDMKQPLHSYIGHDKGSSSSQIEQHDLNPSAPTASLHSIRMAPLGGSTATVKRTSSLKSTLHEPLTYYHRHPSSLKRSESCKSTDAKEIMRSNVKELQKMDHEQILVLLSRMNLNQHKQRFTEEHMDGAVLSECDEEVLQFELGITDETQRTKLINVIKGIDSAKDYV